MHSAFVFLCFFFVVFSQQPPSNTFPRKPSTEVFSGDASTEDKHHTPTPWSSLEVIFCYTAKVKQHRRRNIQDCNVAGNAGKSSDCRVKSKPNLVMLIYSAQRVGKTELWVHPSSQEDAAGRVNEDM